jgi:Leucine-rich repeat (LRR) protein
LLKRLDLSDCDTLTSEGISNLKPLTLRELDLSDCNRISGAGLGSLNSDELESLNLNSCQIDDDGLGELSGFKNLKSLDLQYNDQISGAGLMVISNFNRLEFAAFSGLPLTNECLTTLDGIATLVHLAALPLLDELHLGNNRLVTGEGFSAFAESSRLRQLEMFGLAKLSPAGLKNLPRLANLQSLEIYDVHLTNAHLKSMHDMGKLNYLGLDDTTAVDEAVYESLRESLPKLNE